MPGETKEPETPVSRKALLDAAVEAAKTADVAVVCAGYSSKLETEGKDRPNMQLPERQDELVRAAAAVNKKTMVILNAGDSVDLTRWIAQVPAVVDAWYGGEEGGDALAALLFGDANPSGKLPFSFLKKLEYSPGYGNYPGENLHVKYAEGIYVGYRYFDKHEEIKPLFPFGFGLSYTSFALSALEAPKEMNVDGTATVRVTVTNTGQRRGTGAVQLYVGNPGANVDRLSVN